MSDNVPLLCIRLEPCLVACLWLGTRVVAAAVLRLTFPTTTGAGNDAAHRLVASLATHLQVRCVPSALRFVLWVPTALGIIVLCRRQFQSTPACSHLVSVHNGMLLCALVLRHNSLILCRPTTAAQIIFQATSARLQRRGLGRLLLRCIMLTAVQQGHQVNACVRTLGEACTLDLVGFGERRVQDTSPEFDVQAALV